ncbi:hypothetical protein [Acetobacter oeni]|uniref:hypothetical protein n=1 Tax=Acetobacter oeni TaxID=304077 RepID=UPI0011BE4FBA|nr:hypothetical protein [Acetobacter oeni]MBB3882506.1 hypothetical protein [Acetobacter oeni]NHO18682.1 hypothetical protein [Acetobacter oeni]
MQKILMVCLMIGLGASLSACSHDHYHHRRHDGYGHGGPHNMNGPNGGQGPQSRGGNGPGY